MLISLALSVIVALAVEITLTTSVTVAVAPLARLPTEQFTVPLAPAAGVVQVPCVVPSLWNWTVGSLANGATATVTLVVKVISTAKTAITDSASEISTSYDPKASNDSATVTTNVFGRH